MIVRSKSTCHVLPPSLSFRSRCVCSFTKCADRALPLFRKFLMIRNCIASIERLGVGPMAASDPFLFCVYHKDLYPPAKEKLRQGNGADFDPNQAYRMYHGDKTAGFPQHPHRGFETITATMQGMIDHTDSLGAAGVVHGEMFPQVNIDEPNPCRFFQIWINLPAKNKMVDPSYVMHWNEDIPRVESEDKLSTVTVWAGSLQGVGGLAPPPYSYASDPTSEVAVWFINIKPGGAFAIPKATGGNTVNRKLYWVEGDALQVGDQNIDKPCVISVHADEVAVLTNPSSAKKTVEVLMLQGKPIGEPVAQHGPFVMNTQQEIQKAFSDYRSTQFGGWPWPHDAMVFPPEKGRFTLQNGVEEFPPCGDTSRPAKPPAEMSIRELKEAVKKAGLANDALGFNEKAEFVALLEKNMK